MENAKRHLNCYVEITFKGQGTTAKSEYERLESLGMLVSGANVVNAYSGASGNQDSTIFQTANKTMRLEDSMICTIAAITNEEHIHTYDWNYFVNIIEAKTVHKVFHKVDCEFVPKHR